MSLENALAQLTATVERIANTLADTAEKQASIDTRDTPAAAGTAAPPTVGTGLSGGGELSTAPDFLGDSPAPSKEDVRRALTDLAQKHSPQLSVDVLARFGVNKLPDLAPEQYAAVIDKANAALATGAV